VAAKVAAEEQQKEVQETQAHVCFAGAADSVRVSVFQVSRPLQNRLEVFAGANLQSDWTYNPPNKPHTHLARTYTYN
jgi:hypothetical protein